MDEAGNVRTRRVFMVGAMLTDTRLPERVAETEVLALSASQFLRVGADDNRDTLQLLINARNVQPVLERVIWNTLQQHGVRFPTGRGTSISLEKVLTKGAERSGVNIRSLLAQDDINERLRQWLTDAFIQENDLPLADVIASEHHASIRRARDAWLAWYRSETSTMPPSAWNPHTQAYDFDVHIPTANGTKQLTVAGYRGGGLEWYHFYQTSFAASADQPTESVQLSQTVLPTPISFRGAPAARWWEFEDARANFDGFTASPTDLAHALMLDYRLIFGNDWWMLPLEVPIGTYTRVTNLTVHTNFWPLQDPIAFQNANHNTETWKLFALSGDTYDDEGLFLPPVMSSSLEGEVLDRVRFARDESANLVWGIENAVATPLGSSRSRREMGNEDATAVVPPPTQDEAAALSYHLRTNVPVYWFPFVLQSDSSVFEKRVLTGTTPLGRLLADVTEIDQHTINRRGLQVIRRHVRARWHTGATFVWAAHHRELGEDEARTNFRYDILEGI